MAVDEKTLKEIVEMVSRMPINQVLDELEMIKPDDLAQKGKVATSTIYHRAERGLIPASKVLGGLRFRARAVLACVLMEEKVNMGTAA